jgi:16S rRNA (guanine(966)-N(2))-methyltransferase RsmD
LRIITGKAKGRRLLSIPGLNTRPTSDKIKESIFNILPSDFNGKEVLDLFAGTGNLGIETLSQGAKRAVFIESNHRALSVLEKNIRNCGFIDRSQIIGNTVAKGIRVLENRGDRFDLVFLDPPYGKNILRDTLARVSKAGILNDNALVVVEHSSSETVADNIENLALNDQRRYGKTLVSFFVPGRIEGQGLKS